MSKFTNRVAAFCERHIVLYTCILLAENVVKKSLFRCHTCGQCILSHTAFTCCMRCPKEIRNGPCGGTRENGHCEVYPDRYCIWWLIYERSVQLDRLKKLRKYQKPVDRRLKDTSAWINMLADRIDWWSWGKEEDK